jgi:hypothetical protein
MVSPRRSCSVVAVAIVMVAVVVVVVNSASFLSVLVSLITVASH